MGAGLTCRAGLRHQADKEPPVISWRRAVSPTTLYPQPMISQPEPSHRPDLLRPMRVERPRLPPCPRPRLESKPPSKHHLFHYPAKSHPGQPSAKLPASVSMTKGPADADYIGHEPDARPRAASVGQAGPPRPAEASSRSAISAIFAVRNSAFPFLFASRSRRAWGTHWWSLSLSLV
jgi:hypothetical protein